MPNVRLTVDNKVEFDNDLGEWVKKPPSFIQSRIQPGFKVERWAMAVIAAIADAVQRNIALDIEVLTRKHGWQVTVDER